MHIEQTLGEEQLKILSNFYVKIGELHTNYKNSNYLINYRYKTKVLYIFSNNVTQDSTNNIFNVPYYECTIALKDDSNNYYTNENFDYTNTLNSCTLQQATGGNYTIPLTYNGNSTSRSIASNLYQDNYLDIDKYKTIEVEPSPSPSPEPETPTENGFDSINPYYWILPSFLLMLLIMYKFINGIFSK